MLKKTSSSEQISYGLHLLIPNLVCCHGSGIHSVEAAAPYSGPVETHKYHLALFQIFRLFSLSDFWAGIASADTRNPLEILMEYAQNDGEHDTAPDSPFLFIVSPTPIKVIKHDKYKKTSTEDDKIGLSTVHVRLTAVFCVYAFHLLHYCYTIHCRYIITTEHITMLKRIIGFVNTKLQ